MHTLPDLMPPKTSTSDAIRKPFYHLAEPSTPIPGADTFSQNCLASISPQESSETLDSRTEDDVLADYVRKRREKRRERSKAASQHHNILLHPSKSHAYLPKAMRVKLVNAHSALKETNLYFHDDVNNVNLLRVKGRRSQPVLVVREHLDNKENSDDSSSSDTTLTEARKEKHLSLVATLFPHDYVPPPSGPPREPLPPAPLPLSAVDESPPNRELRRPRSSSAQSSHIPLSSSSSWSNMSRASKIPQPSCISGRPRRASSASPPTQGGQDGWRTTSLTPHKRLPRRNTSASLNIVPYSQASEKESENVESSFKGEIARSASDGAPAFPENTGLDINAGSPRPLSRFSIEAAKDAKKLDLVSSILCAAYDEAELSSTSKRLSDIDPFYYDNITSITENIDDQPPEPTPPADYRSYADHIPAFANIAGRLSKLDARELDDIQRLKLPDDLYPKIEDFIKLRTLSSDERDIRKWLLDWVTVLNDYLDAHYGLVVEAKADAMQAMIDLADLKCITGGKKSVPRLSLMNKTTKAAILRTPEVQKKLDTAISTRGMLLRSADSRRRALQQRWNVLFGGLKNLGIPCDNATLEGDFDLSRPFRKWGDFSSEEWNVPF
ncbi:hypothetical protein DL93DRAFT_2155871 [Clavulina sp. PMI_390]|nr:hypothetical protein DL93DRAFT_2155871 [Clavulina sp. PMI_390]